MAGRGRGAALTVPAWMKDSATAARAAALPAALPVALPAAAAAPPAADWERATAADGRPYWYSRTTRATTWDDPTVKKGNGAAGGSRWKKVVGDAGRVYYYDAVSRETRWEPPEGFADDAEEGAAAGGGGGVGAMQQIRAVVAGGNAGRAVGGAAAAAAAEAALPEGWVEYKTPQGKPYFHCARLQKTVWTRPTAADGSAATTPALASAAESAAVGAAAASAPAAMATSVAATAEAVGLRPAGTGTGTAAAMAAAAVAARRERDLTVIPVAAVAARRRRTRTRAAPRGSIMRPQAKDGGRYLDDRETEAYFLARARRERARLEAVDAKARRASGKGERGEVGAKERRKAEAERKRKDASEYVHRRKRPEKSAWEARQLFEAVMADSGVTKESSWLETIGRCTPDERYGADGSLKSYSFRKQAYSNYVAKLARAAREAECIAKVQAEEQFGVLLRECFGGEPPSVMSLKACAPEAIARFENDPRYARLESDVLRAEALRAYFRDRERLAREHRTAALRKLQDGLRDRLDAATDPELRRRRPPAAGDSADAAECEDEKPAVVAGTPVRWLTDRSSLTEAEARVRDTREFKELEPQVRASVLHAWLGDVKRAVEGPARAARKRFVHGVEKMVADGDVSFRAMWPDVARKVSDSSFATDALAKGYIAPPALQALFDDGIVLFYRRVDAKSDAFRDALRKAEGFALTDATTVDDLRNVDTLAAVLDGLPDGVVAALLYERRKKEARRKEAAIAEFEDLLRRREVDAITDWAALKTTIADRTAYKQVRDILGSDEGVEALFKGVVERRERRRKRERDVPGPPPPKDWKGLGSLIAPGDGHGSKRLKSAPGRQRASKAEEDSGWAAALSGKDEVLDSKARKEERDRRKREILAASESQGSVGKKTAS